MILRAFYRTYPTHMQDRNSQSMQALEDIFEDWTSVCDESPADEAESESEMELDLLYPDSPDSEPESDPRPAGDQPPSTSVPVPLSIAASIHQMHTAAYSKGPVGSRDSGGPNDDSGFKLAVQSYTRKSEHGPQVE